MADRYPLIVDSSSQQIKELPDGDSLLLGDNEKLKIGEHRTFFRNLFRNNIKILYCEKLRFKEFNKLRKYDKNGTKMRKRA